MKKSQLSSLIRLFRYAKDQRKNVILAITYSIINTFLNILPEVLIGIAIDIIVYKHHSMLAKFGFTDIYSQLLILCAVTITVWLLDSLFEYLHLIKWKTLAQSIQHQLRMDAYWHIQSTDMNYFESVSNGYLVSILNDDINQLERFLDNGLNLLIQILASTVFVGAFFLFISAKIAFMTFMPIPFILFGMYFFQNLIGPKYDLIRQKSSELSSRFINNIMGIATIKSYTAEEYEYNSLEKQSLQYQAANQQAIRISSAITPAIRIIVLIGFISTLIYGGWLAINNHLDVGAYSILVFLSQRLLWPLTYLSEVMDHFYRAMASTNRVLNLLNVPIHITSGTLTPIPELIKGKIKFENLGFYYQPEKPIIKNLNIEIQPGEIVGFVGSTGSGKSTIIKLLLRFYDPTLGQIQLDDKNLKNYDLELLRKQIGYVSQDVFLFNGSVLDNIRYGNFSAPISEAIEAAKLAEAHDFISKMMHGYDTIIGEGGQKLSGGQRQRLGLARAILKNPPILILDEATAALDNETEAAIQRSLENVISDRTTILIAHRLSTVRHADTIYVLENGQVVEQGNHHSLLEIEDGIYAWLWQLQTGVI